MLFYRLAGPVKKTYVKILSFLCSLSSTLTEHFTHAQYSYIGNCRVYHLRLIIISDMSTLSSSYGVVMISAGPISRHVAEPTIRPNMIR